MLHSCVLVCSAIWHEHWHLSCIVVSMHHHACHGMWHQACLGVWCCISCTISCHLAKFQVWCMIIYINDGKCSYYWKMIVCVLPLHCLVAGCHSAAGLRLSTCWWCNVLGGGVGHKWVVCTHADLAWHVPGSPPCTGEWLYGIVSCIMWYTNTKHVIDTQCALWCA